MNPPESADDTTAMRAGRWVLLVASCLLPVSLLWDVAWESTVGIDRVWAGPHIANYLAVVLAAAGGLLMWKSRFAVGAWLAVWGAVAYGAAFLFDRWWQAGYGLAAGIWHPPQILKAVAFFAIVCGAWWCGKRRVAVCGGGFVLAMIGVVTLASNFANRQHSAWFYQIACATYPFVLSALAVAAPVRFSATKAAGVAMVLQVLMVWLLPLIPGSPLGGPIYNPRDHLMPPPFPLLLLPSALAMDCLLRAAMEKGWAACWRAGEAGLGFFVAFAAVQWPFAAFLLSPSADGWFFAGGGKHWPFFLRIDEAARVSFWPDEPLDLKNSLIAIALAAVAVRLGMGIGAWLRRMPR